MVFKLYVEGYDVNTIAIRLKRSKKTIYNTIASFKEKMKVLLEKLILSMKNMF